MPVWRIEENVPIGTRVGKISAFDPDRLDFSSILQTQAQTYAALRPMAWDSQSASGTVNMIFKQWMLDGGLENGNQLNRNGSWQMRWNQERQASSRSAWERYRRQVDSKRDRSVKDTPMSAIGVSYRIANPWACSEFHVDAISGVVTTAAELDHEKVGFY
ncbi:unnamed protein product [Protopolystoma xenopodis]|uniref:Uncharacterized protein n=1 Tax=Protopolystoma xenopodis TaxID=117903 RepID=A0A3S5C1H4_9PLAT|nr:unnamed protein product [Protopolystoma xenopodis]